MINSLGESEIKNSDILRKASFTASILRFNEQDRHHKTRVGGDIFKFRVLLNKTVKVKEV
jgi:hypothetical protein